MSNISDEEIEKLATNFHVHFGYIYDQREKKIKPKEIVEWFIKNCINFSHQNKVSDPATEQSTSNWQAVGDKDKFMDEVRGNESAWKENSPMDKRWHVYPSSGHEIKPTHWKPIESQPK